MFKLNMRTALFLSAATIQAISSAPCSAQAQASGDQAGAIETVVVTAEKREERLQDVPSSVAVLTGENLEHEGAVGLSDLQKQIPAMNFVGGSGPGQGQVVFRGLTTGSDLVSSVGIYIDGVPFSRSVSLGEGAGESFDPDLVDIERVEFLKGPQSTLYGANAEGGIINYITKQPNLDDFSGSLRVSGTDIEGNGAGYGLRGSINIPILPDTLGLRASGYYRDDPGFISNDYYGQHGVNSDKVGGFRASLRWQITPDLETTVSGLLQTIDQNAPNYVFLNPTTLKPSSGHLSYSSPVDQPIGTHYSAISDSTNWTFGFATLTNIASYTKFNVVNDYDFSIYGGYVGLPAGDYIRYQNINKTSRFADEIRLASAPGTIEWLLGGYYTKENGVNPEILRPLDSSGNFLPSSSPYYNIYTVTQWQNYEEKSIFGDLTYNVTDKFQVMAGMRYTSVDQPLHWESDGLLGVNNPPGTDARATNDSYLVTASYKPDADTTLYARAASGFRPGGANVLNSIEIAGGAPLSYKPDKLWNYEAGVKGSLWDQHVRYSADVYRMDWTNLQLTEIIGGFYAYTNASSARSQGAELSVQANPIDNLSLALDAAYTDAAFTADAPSLDRKSGNPLPYSPKYMVAIVGDYYFNPIGTATPSVGLTYAFHSSQNTALANGSVYQLGSISTLDLRFGLEWSNYSLVARIENVTNTYGVTYAYGTSALGAPLAGTVVRPRTFGLSLEARF